MKAYDEWPSDPMQRRKMARIVLAHGISDLRRRGISRADRILSGQLPKVPNQAEHALAKWANDLTSQEKAFVRSVAEQSIRSVLFGMLVMLDGADGGSWVPSTATRYRLDLVIQVDGSNEEELVHLNAPEDEDLHDELYDAMEGRVEDA